MGVGGLVDFGGRGDFYNGTCVSQAAPSRDVLTHLAQPKTGSQTPPTSIPTTPAALLDPRSGIQVCPVNKFRPGQEIWIAQVGGKKLVLGATATQITTLSELPEHTPVNLQNTPQSKTYQKYLPSTPNTTPTPSWGSSLIPSGTNQNTGFLADYPDQFEDVF